MLKVCCFTFLKYTSKDNIDEIKVLIRHISNIKLCPNQKFTITPANDYMKPHFVIILSNEVAVLKKVSLDLF